MDPDDYWTHVGLVTFFFVVVVAPRLSSPGQAANSLTYIINSIVVIAVATTARRTRRDPKHSGRNRRELSDAGPPRLHRGHLGTIE